VVWSASRTSLVALAAVGLAALGLVLVRDKGRFAAWWLAVVAACAIALPFVTRAPTAFTNRGGYWIASLESWRSSPWLGHGADFFKQIALGDENLGGHAYHAHNQVVHVLVTGGLVLAGIALAVLILLGVRAVRWARRGFTWPVLVLTALAVTASFEVTIGLVDRLVCVPFVLVPLGLVAFADPELERA
ncbi:MAG: O-antigen ligase family protein, partial [Actinomycetales bacterium]|nr:O-antigen ligase family protein [Actinomycetales bacterium]